VELRAGDREPGTEKFLWRVNQAIRFAQEHLEKLNSEESLRYAQTTCHVNKPEDYSEFEVCFIGSTCQHYVEVRVYGDMKSQVKNVISV